MYALAPIILWLLLGSIAAPAPAAAAAGAIPGAEAIRAADLMRTVEYLAAPRLRGRLAGSPGYMTAAREMAARFRRLGLEHGGDDGFFQNLDVEYNEIETCRLALVRPDGSARSLRLGPDFLCRGLTGSGDFTAPVAFLGYGMSRPEQGYDDYAGLDVRGKVVLAFKEPPPFKADTAGWGGSASLRVRGLVAAAHGAVGMLIVSGSHQPESRRPIGSVLEGEAEQDERFPRLHVDVPVAEELARASGLDLRGVQAEIDSTRAPRSRDLGASVRVAVRARYHPRQRSANVVGILRGADPALAGQCLVLGAHLDHVGGQAGEIYFPGANDDASGVAAVMAIAEAFARGGARPKRTVVFGLWSSEESGIQGASRFVADPPVPSDSIVAYLNFDCVGHGDSIQVGGGKTYPRLWQVVRDLDAGGARLMVEATWPGGGADAEAFEKQGIANLYFASKFSYTHIHLPSDTPATLNPRLLEALTRLGYEASSKVARGEYSRE